jgi:nucleotide-binding universal stress UspA family protein
MKILLATDGSSYSEAAAREVANRPWPAGSSVKIISVMETPIVATEVWSLPPNFYEEMGKALRVVAQETVAKASSIITAQQSQTLDVSTEILEGKANRAIIEEAEKWGADLIIVGSHGYGWWGRTFLGSVSQAVVLHAPCSVEIVRPRQKR